MKIAVLTQYFPPDAHGWISATVARELNERGHEVKVLTTFPHYNTGKIAEGYRQALVHYEEIDGVPVRRVPLFPSHSRNPAGRVLNYLSFTLSARLASKWIQDVDVVYVYGSPATSAEVARSLFKRHDIPFVYHVVDIWPESVTESGFLPQRVLNLMKRGLDFWLSKVYRDVGAVIAIAPTARDILVTRGVPVEKANLIYNWSADEDPLPRSTGKGTTVLYAGNFGDYQDLDSVIRAAEAMKDYSDFRLKLAGSGLAEQRLKEMVLALGLEKTVEFLGRVERSEMPRLYAESDFQIVPLKNLPFFEATIPSKFQMGLAHGVPVITTVKGDISDIVIRNQLGFVAEPENVDSIASALKVAHQMNKTDRARLSDNALEFFQKNFTEEKAIDGIEKILRKVVEPHIDQGGAGHD